MSSEALERAVKESRASYVPGTPEKYPKAELRGFTILEAEALLVEVATLEQEREQLVRELRAAEESEQRYWQERDEACEKARLLEAALAVERGHLGDEYARERVARLEQERDEARKERDARRERKVVVEELGAELAEARKREQRLRDALEEIAEASTLYPATPDGFVGAWEDLAEVARAALVDEPAAATCPECGSEMGEVCTYRTGVCPHHGVRPAAATLAEPEGPNPAQAATVGESGSASAAADEPGEQP